MKNCSDCIKIRECIIRRAYVNLTCETLKEYLANTAMKMTLHEQLPLVCGGFVDISAHVPKDADAARKRMRK